MVDLGVDCEQLSRSYFLCPFGNVMSFESLWHRIYVMFACNFIVFKLYSSNWIIL